MTDISKEAVERLARTADLFAKAMKAWQHQTQKHNEDVRDTLRALSARVEELEAALNAPNRHAYKVGVAVGKATGIPEAEERSDD